VDSIDGLSPAISIEQKTTSRSPRSTVGTITEIYDYLRLLYSSIGTPHCPVCGNRISRQTTEQILGHVLALKPEDRIMVLAPVARGRKGEYKKDLEKLARQGFVRARIDGILRSLDEDIVLDKRRNHTIEVVVDRLLVKAGIEKRLEASIDTATKLANGLVLIAVVNGEERRSGSGRGFLVDAAAAGGIREEVAHQPEETVRRASAGHARATARRRRRVRGHSGDLERDVHGVHRYLPRMAHGVHVAGGMSGLPGQAAAARESGGAREELFYRGVHGAAGRARADDGAQLGIRRARAADRRPRAG
jgi:hypothetical protein